VADGPPDRSSTTQMFPALSYAPDLDMYLYASAVASPNRTDTWQLPGASLGGAVVVGSGTTLSGVTLSGVSVQ